MPLSRLENFLKNAEGNILYVNPSDFDATDSYENQGNSLTRPFKTIQRALIEAARFSYQSGKNNDRIDRTTILVYPGTHYIDNRPGFSIQRQGSKAIYKKRTGTETWSQVNLPELNDNTNYNILDTNNDLYKFNSVLGGAILPRGTSIIGYDLRKTKIRPLYVPNPEDSSVDNTSIFNVTGTCYFSTFTFLDADQTKTVFRDYTDNRFVPNFSHHKIVSFAYADGVNKVALGTEQTDLTDLDMYYYKVAKAYGDITGRGVLDYPTLDDFEPSKDEFRIVGELQANPLGISSISGGDGVTQATNVIKVTTKNLQTGEELPHGLFVDSPVLISGITTDASAFNGSFTVREVVGVSTFTYTSTSSPSNPNPNVADYETGIVTIESDSVSSASPYVFNCSIRSAYGLCGMWADGNKADGFKSMVVAQFTGVSLQKDDNAFIVYNKTTGKYEGNDVLALTSNERPLHTNGNAIYKPDYEGFHIRVSNNGFVQCVSIFAIGFAKHFITESGGDMSITNSNSNFGAISLESVGYRNESFDRDDVGYITHIIPPKEVDELESNINWISFDVPKTISVGLTERLYLYNYKNKEVSPSKDVDGFKIGAKTNDTLNLNIVIGIAQTVYSSPILMPVVSGVGVTAYKSYTVSRSGNLNQISNNVLTLNANHQLINGESVRIFSDTGEVPNGLTAGVVAYAITTGVALNQIKLAYSLNDAIAENEIEGINNRGGVLTVVSSVTDKKPGDIGSPIQYDDANGQWYVLSSNSSDNQIFPAIVGFGTTSLGNETSSTFVKRKLDNRSIQDRIYRLRYVVPKEYTNARPPQAGFVLQESKTINISPISFDYTQSITEQTPPAYLRNEKIIKNATVGAVSGGNQTVTITTEKPHKFFAGDKVKVQRIKSENNPTAVGINSTYNGSYVISSVPSSKTFTYVISGVKINPGTFTNQVDERDTNQERSQIPLVSREEYENDFYIYRVDTIKSHIPGLNGQDGIYHLIVLSSNVSPSSDIGYNLSFKSFNQDVRNLYPQIDRDNFSSDPSESVSYADASVIGKVVTNDKRKSVTRETINTFLKNSNVGFGITGVVASGTGYTTVTIHTNVEHNFNSIKSISVKNPTGAGTSGAGYGNTTIYSSNLIGGTGQGASLYVPVIGSTGTINASSIKIVDVGSVYSVGDVLDISGPSGITPTIYAKAEVLEINNNVGDALEIRGFNTTNLDGVYRITNVPSSKSIEIYVPSGVPSYQSNTNGRIPVAVLSAEGIGINLFRFDSTVTGIVTVTTNNSHGLLRGNKFTIVGSGHTIYDKTFVVKENVGLNTFTFNVGVVTQTKSSTTGTLLKHSISSNELVLSRGEDTLGSRASYFYAGITTTLSSTILVDSTSITLTSSKGFDRGDYVVINNEIIRLANSTTSNTFNVLRGRFSTFKTTAEAGTQVKKINVMPMEVRRPSFLRASGHTFEYLGYGPGNYSTGMPQKQTRILTEDDVLVSQARKQKGGVVVYTGMNDVGEFYSGAKKLSSSTGEEKIVEAPILSYTGDDAEGTNTNKLDVTFDNILARGRITVEGGEGAKETSQFYGPVSFNKKVVSTSDEGINTKNLYIRGDTTSNKLLTVGLSTPTDANLVNSGNISLKSQPNEGYIGQVYANGEWKKFGPISQSKDILDFKVDKIGIGNSNEFTDTADPGVNDVVFYVGGKSKFKDVVFSGDFKIESSVTLNNVNFADINVTKTAFFSGITSVSGISTTHAIYVYNPGTVINSQSVPRLISRFYDLEVAGVSTFSNNAIFSGSVGIGTTNPGTKLRVVGDTQFDGNVRVGISTTSNYIAFRGTYNDDQTTYTHTFIGERLYERTGGSANDERSELLLFKGNDPASTSTGPGPDRIRLAAAEIRFDIGNPPGGGTFEQVATSANITNKMILTGDGNLGIGTTNPTSKLVVNGTIGIDASSSTAGRTQLSSSASGFVLNHNDNSDIILQNQGTERFRVGAARTATYTSTTTGTDLKGSHFKLKNDGIGDVVLSWFANAASNQRWYAGIDASDGYSWKLASPNSSVVSGQENFDSVGENSARNQVETKLRVNSDGDLSVLGSLTLNGLNTPSRFEVDSNGITNIRGSLNLFNLVNTSGATVTVSDITVNGDKFTVAGNTGNITTKGTIVSDGTLTVNSDNQSIFGGSLGVTGAITAGSFVKTGGGSLNGVSNILRANGGDTTLTTQDIVNALGFAPQPPIATSNLPTGNSEVLTDISGGFNGTGKSFALTRTSGVAFIPLGPDNLIVSLGGVIQKPSTDYTIRQVNGAYTNTIDFVDAPPAKTPCFILALGGQGSLVSNQDWNKKGEILVATADNAAIQLRVPVTDPNNQNSDPLDNYILTTDKSTSTGLAWKSSFAGNASTVTNGFYTTSSFNLGTTSIAVNRASGALSLTGVSIDGSSGSCTGNAETATNANNINIFENTSSDTLTSVVLVNDQLTGNQRPFIDSGLTYNASSNTLTAGNLSAGNLSGTLNNALTLTTSGTGLSGSTTYNNSGATTFTVTSNATSSNEGGKIVARDANGDFNARSIVAQTLTGTLNNTLTLTTSGTGLSGSTTYNNSGARTFTVTSNATSSNEGGKIVARNADGDFSARYITATEGFLGNALTVTNGVYTTDFAKNTNSKGYQSFPGGFTIQWGNSSSLIGKNASEAQTFAKPFTSAVFSVVATPSSDNPPPGDKQDHWSCLNVSLSGFTMRSYMEGKTQTYRWIAIGI
jgi:hypothetical protein